MEVGDNKAHIREIQALNRLLKERDKEHVEEIEHLKKSNRERIENLEKEQSRRFEEARQEDMVNIENQRKGYDTDIENTIEDFQHKLDKERRDSYTRLGRLTQDYEGRIHKQKAISQRQIDDMVRDKTRGVTGERHEKESALEKQLTRYNRNLRDMKDFYEEKLDDQVAKNDEALAKTVFEARRATDDAIRDAREDVRKEKLANDLRLKLLSHAHNHVEANQKRTNDLRVKQLQDEKEEKILEGRKIAGDAVEKVRENTYDYINQKVAENNFKNAALKEQHAETESKSFYEAKRREDVLKLQMRREREDAKTKLEQEKQKASLILDRNSKRAALEKHLLAEKLRRSHHINSENQKEEFRDALRDIERKNQENMKTFQRQVQKRVIDLEQQAALKQQTNAISSSHALDDLQVRNEREKRNMVREYKLRQDALDNLRKRQLAESDQEFRKQVTKKQNEKDIAVFKAHREKQEAVFATNEKLKLRTEAMEAAKKRDASRLTDDYANKLDKNIEKFNRTIQKQQNHFEETTGDLRRSSQLQLARLQTRKDHETRIQLMDLQQKNRLLSNKYERQIQNLKEENELELDLIKEKHRKELRQKEKDLALKLERVEDRHKHEKTISEHQHKEKMRLQQESFEEQIDKLKHSNALLLKKS